MHRGKCIRCSMTVYGVSNYCDYCGTGAEWVSVGGGSYHRCLTDLEHEAAKAKRDLYNFPAGPCTCMYAYIGVHKHGCPNERKVR